MFQKYRKIIFISTILIFCTLVSNSWANNQFIYIGGSATYSITKFNLKNVDTEEDLSTGSVNTTQGGAFIGYGVLIDYVYLGAEGGFQFGRRITQNDEVNENLDVFGDNQITMDEIYIVDFRPGYVIFNNNNIIYGIVGFNTANFHVSGEESGCDFDSGPMRKNGLRFGIGYNLGLGKHFMGRVEYVFTKFFENEFDVTLNNNQNVTWQLNPYSNEISAALAVIFSI